MKFKLKPEIAAAIAADIAALDGATKVTDNVRRNTMVDCKECDGKGLNPTNSAELCPACKGSGKVVSDKPKDSKK